MRVLRPASLLAAFALWLATAAWAEVPVPTLNARVTDLTGTLSAATRSALEHDLQSLEARNGSQLAVLLVPSTQPETIEQYSLRVFEAWKLGHKGVDNGLLLVLAKNDRKLRIEVGYGLEGTIPDAIARRVIDETITPFLKQGNFDAGISSGVMRLSSLIEGQTAKSTPAESAPEANPEETLPAPPPDEGPVPIQRSLYDRLISDSSEFPTWLLVLLVAVGTGLRWFLGPFFGGVVMGGAVGGGTWLLSGSAALGAFAGLAAFIFVLVGITNWIAMGMSGSSRGGGGFSGGGGSSGGGGASGSW